MNWIEALILGILQGLTEYLPVSSSGHLAIGSALFGIEGEENLTFTIVVHVATVLSTLVILWKEIDWIFRGLFKWQLNEETKYVLNIIISMVPIGIVGVFFKDYVEEIFGSGLLIVGCMLLLTAVLLTFSYYAKPRQKERISMRGCVYYRTGTGLCGNAGTVALGKYDRYRADTGKQEGNAGSVFFPDGDTADSGRGFAGWNEDYKGCFCGKCGHQYGIAGGRLPGCFRFGMYRM